jgi:hypothetical protein
MLKNVSELTPWPYTPEQLKTIAARFPANDPLSSIDYVRQAAGRYALADKIQAPALISVATGVVALIHEMNAFPDTLIGTLSQKNSDNLADLLAALERFSAAQCLPGNAAKKKGGRPVKRSERQLIAQLRKAWRSAYGGRNAPGFWPFFSDCVVPLKKFGLDPHLANSSPKDTWHDAWKHIEGARKKHEDEWEAALSKKGNN